MSSLESTPQILERPPQPYVAARENLTMSTLSRIADRIPELIAWLAQCGHTPSGAPFFRYVTIDMDRGLEVEAGVPFTAPLDLPREQPDMNAWRTELASRLADGTTQS